MSFRHVQFIIQIQNKISPNIFTLQNGVLRPNLLNNLFASWFLIDLDFLLPHILHFDNTIVLPLIVFQTLRFMFSVFFVHFKQYDFICIPTYLNVLHLNITHKIPNNFSLKFLTLYDSNS